MTPIIVSSITRAFDFNYEEAKCDFLEKFSLTDREKDIIHLVYEGKSNKEIAEHLFLSENTVKKHVSNIFEKMGLNSRNKLLNYLNREGYKIFE